MKNLRILWAITTKDLLEALKNKNAITVVVTAMFVILMYRAYPLLDKTDTPVVHAYAAGKSELAEVLKNNPALNFRLYDSESKVIERLTDSENPELGLIIPANFDQMLQDGSPPEITGLVVRWVNAEDAEELRATVERDMSQQAGAPITITLADPVPMEPESGGLSVLAAISILFYITMAGMTMTPHLILEEKLSHTFDALLISPASEVQIALGKALTGLFYCLVGGVVGLLLYQSLVVHWWLAILAVFCGALVTVTLGLWIGLQIENRGQLTIWVWVLLLPMMLPLMLVLMEPLFPRLLVQIMRFTPTVVAFNLLRMAFAETFPVGDMAWMVFWCLSFAGLVTLAIAWKLKRQDRVAEGRKTSQQALAQINQGLLRPVDNVQDKIIVPLNRPSPLTTLSAADIKPVSAWGIIWAIAKKDILSAIKNKLFISIFLGVLVLVGSNSLLPLLIYHQLPPAVVIYDESSLNLSSQIVSSNDLRVVFAKSSAEMEKLLTDIAGITFGLVIPAGFENASSGDTISLEVQRIYWMDANKINQAIPLVIEKLNRVSSASIRIKLADQLLYPSSIAGGHALMILIILGIVILTMGASVVPLLIVEEKEARTMDALRVSPAGSWQILIAKLIAGSTYCLLAAVIVMLINIRTFAHIWVVVLAIVVSGVFSVTLGLLIGILANNPSVTGMMGGLILLGMILGTALSFTFGGQLSPLVAQLLSLLPGEAAMRLFNLSLVEHVPLLPLMTNSVAVLAAAGLLALISGLMVRRMDR